MLEFYEKRKLRRVLYSKPVLVVLFLLVLAFLIPVWGAYQKVVNTHEQRIAVAAELHELRTREHILQEEINRLETPQGVEAEIRKKYELGREGEELIVIVGDAKPEVRKTTESQERRSFFGRLFSF